MKKNLSSLKTRFLGLLAGTVLLTSVTASADTVAHYRFEGFDPWVAVDSVNGYDMTAFGSPQFTPDVATDVLPRTGAPNDSAADFTGGQHAYIGQAGDALSQVVFTDFTVEAWVRFTNPSGWQVFVGRDDSVPAPGQGVGLLPLFHLGSSGEGGQNNGFRAQIITADNREMIVRSSRPVLANVWYHVAVVGDAGAGTMAIYVDGELTGIGFGFTGLFIPASPATPWTIGRGFFNTGPGDYVNAIVDEVRISNTALSPSEFLNVDLSAPWFVKNLADVAAWEGQDWTFETEFRSVDAATFRWEQRAEGSEVWTAIAGADSSSFTLTDIALGQDRTEYRVVANVNGVDYPSENALLRVGNPVVSPPQGVVGYYRFEEGEAAGAFDSSGNENHMVADTAVEPPSSSSVPVSAVPNNGLENNFAADFAGQSVAYTSGDALNDEPFDNVTVETWVNFNNPNGWQIMVGRDDSGSPGQGAGSDPLFAMYTSGNIAYHNGFRVMAMTRSGRLDIHLNQLVAPNRWYHVAAVGDSAAGTFSLYVDGVLQGRLDGFDGLLIPTDPANTPWTIGRGQWAGNKSDWLNGKMDEVRISNVALEPHEFLNFSAAVLSILSQPQDVETTALKPVDFEVAAAGGAGDIIYQWQMLAPGAETWENIGGAEADSHTIDAALLAHDGNQYRVIITRGSDTATSSPATLSVLGYPEPVVTQDLTPGPLVPEGESFTYSVAATGLGNITYQWQLNGADLPTETGPTLTINEPGVYSVIISDDRATQEEGTPATTVTLSSVLSTYEPVKEAISFNFVGTANGPPFTSELAILDPTDVAGAVPVANWNNSATTAGVANQGSPVGLVNDLGEPTAVAATWTSANAWGARLSGGLLPNKDAHQRIFHGYIETRNTPSTVTITNIPFDSYDVYVYAMGVEGSAATTMRQVSLEDNSGERSLYGRNHAGAAPHDSVPYILTHAASVDEAIDGPGTTFFRFEGASGSTATIRHYDVADWGWNAGGIAAFQIVDTTGQRAARPVFSSRPEGKVVPAGASLSWTATAESVNPNGALSYQWLKDGSQVATGPTYTIASATSGDTGLYSLVVTEDSDLGASTNAVDFPVVVAGAGGYTLISSDMNVGTQDHMSGNGVLREDGSLSQSDIGAGDTVWNRLVEWSIDSVYRDFHDSANLGLPGLTLRFASAGTVNTENVAGGGGMPGDGWNDYSNEGDPLLRDYIYTTGEDEMTMTLGGLSAFAGREVVLTVYALGKDGGASQWANNSGVIPENDDVATVTLAAQNSATGEAQSGTTDMWEGRSLVHNPDAHVTFNAVVAPNGTITWTVGPRPGYPGLNAFNGFQLLLTDGGEAPEFTQVEAWRQLYFGTIDNTGDAADSADPDGDGFENGLEYALGTVPTQAGDAQGAVSAGTAGGFLTLTFSHIDDPSLVYEVEASNDLSAAWSVVSGYGPFTAIGIETYTDSVPVGDAGSRFLRLRVTRTQ